MSGRRRWVVGAVLAATVLCPTDANRSAAPGAARGIVAREVGVPVNGGPSTSLATFPAAYYGAVIGTRSETNIEMLARMRVVVLMQEEGVCWTKCCPHWDNATYAGVCQPPSVEPAYNASTFAGCNPGCDQHATQNAVFDRVKAVGQARGWPPVHAMLYMNAVYLWPFDRMQAGGNAVDILDTHGKPHVEVSDPGIFPSFFLDFGRASGRQAFVEAVQRYVVNGTADGVFLDNFGEIPMSCTPRASDNCTVLRNRWASKYNQPSQVTAAQVADYTTGKNESLTAAASLINRAGGALAAFTWGTKPNSNGATMAALNVHPNSFTPDTLGPLVNTAFANGYSRVLIMPHAFSSPTGHNNPTSQCSELQVALFLLVVRPGVYLACNGWSDDFARPLGDPVGPATTTDGVMRRAFAAGAVAEWVVNTTTGSVHWP